MPLDADGYPEGWTGPRDTDGDVLKDTLGWFKGFGESALWTIPEFVGIHPSTETEEWRQDHPVGSFVSQMIGGATPYLGWMRAARLIKPLHEVAEALSAKGLAGAAAG